MRITQRTLAVNSLRGLNSNLARVNNQDRVSNPVSSPARVSPAINHGGV